MSDSTATPVVVVLFPSEAPNDAPAHEVDPTTLAGFDTQWTINTSNDPGRIENLVKGEVLTEGAPNGLATYVAGKFVQQIGAYGATDVWPVVAPVEPEASGAPVISTPIVLTLTADGHTATQSGVPVASAPLPADHPAHVLPIGTVITQGESSLHVQPPEPLPAGHSGFLQQVDEDAKAFWARVRQGIVALGHKLRGQA